MSNKYKVEFHVRRVVCYNVYKTIEAESLEKAKRQAQNMTEEFDSYIYDDEEIVDTPEEEACVFKIEEE
jgi:hypothetical protein